MMRLMQIVSLLLLSSHLVVLCSGAATWSVSVASGFSSYDYSQLDPINNAPDSNWVVQPPGTSEPQPARITWPGGGNWPGSAWLANGPLSAWISVSANDYKLGAGNYNFTRSFMVPSAVQASSVVFTGSISCDNDCNMLFNGARIGSYWSSTYAALVPFSINLGSTIRPGQMNQLRINLTDYGSQNAIRIQGTISGTLTNYWSTNVATGWTTIDYTGSLSNVNAAKDAHWMVKRPQWNAGQQAEICTPAGGNFPTDNSWPANGPLSTWIAVGCTSYTQGQVGQYDFTYTFMLPANLDPYTVSFVGAIACDDNCNVLINGNLAGPNYGSAWNALRYFSYDWSAGWVVGGSNTITINMTDTGFFNGVRLEGTVQARTRMSSSTGRSITAAPAKRCPYWADGTYYPRCFCPGEGVFPYCDCPAPYKGEIPYDCYALYPDPDDPDWRPTTSTGGSGSSESSLSAGVIALIVLGVLVALAGAAYLYRRYYGSAASAPSQQDASNLMAHQTHSDHLGGTASHSQPAPQGGLDYYMSAPTNGQPAGQRT